MQTKVTHEQLLGEIEDVLRGKPSRENILRQTDEGVEWLGSVAAVLMNWDFTSSPSINGAVVEIQSMDPRHNHEGLSRLIGLLYQARADLRMEVGLLSVVVPHGNVFDYFDEVRKVIEVAQSEVFFVDPYLGANFVSRYLPHTPIGVNVRLLGTYKMSTLLPAVEAFVQVGQSLSLHDRFLFVDRNACYLSGASFKDGPKNAPATLTQIADSFPAVWDTYDELWNGGKVER